MNVVARLSHVTFRRPGASQPALDDIDLELGPGEVVALIGASGAGKSTLLALLDDRLRGWTGHAEVHGRRLDARRALPRHHRSDSGFVFQEFALVDRATVRQNVLNGRLGRTGQLASLFGRFSRADHLAVERALSDVGIADLADQRADRLSGGQRQRVAIARCLAQDPALILADEPVSNLDPVRAEAILQLITTLASQRDASVVFTSHQPAMALRFAPRVVALRDGRVDHDGRAAGISGRDLDALYADASPDPRLRVAV